MRKFLARFTTLLAVLLVSGVTSSYAAGTGGCTSHCSLILHPSTERASDQALSLITALPPADATKHTVKAHIAEVVEEEDGGHDEFSVRKKPSNHALTALLCSKLLAAILDRQERGFASHGHVSGISPRRHIFLRILRI